MKVKELIKLLSEVDEELEVFTQKNEVFGNIGCVFALKEDNYSSWGVVEDCILITDDLPDEAGNEYHSLRERGED